MNRSARLFLRTCPSKAVQRPLGGLGEGTNPRAPSQAPSGTPDVNRDAQANCPTIATNTVEFGRPKQPDHHVL
jgi:hypothetical protein